MTDYFEKIRKREKKKLNFYLELQLINDGDDETPLVEGVSRVCLLSYSISFRIIEVFERVVMVEWWNE